MSEAIKHYGAFVAATPFLESPSHTDGKYRGTSCMWCVRNAGSNLCNVVIVLAGLASDGPQTRASRLGHASSAHVSVACIILPPSHTIHPSTFPKLTWPFPSLATPLRPRSQSSTIILNPTVRYCKALHRP